MSPTSENMLLPFQNVHADRCTFWGYKNIIIFLYSVILIQHISDFLSTSTFFRNSDVFFFPRRSPRQNGSFVIFEYCKDLGWCSTQMKWNSELQVRNSK
jgi:hypothetical protein